MSVDKTPTGVVYTVTNGAVGQQYPLTFPYINGADVKAYYVLNGTQTVLTYGVHYAVSSQIFTASIALPLGAKLAIYRQTDLTQEILWKDGQSVYTPDIMKADDKLTLIAQEIAADMSRTVKLTREEEAAGGKPEEVVQAIYASRDAAAASASTASAQATAAQYSADMAAHSAEMAAQTVQTATADVVTAATTQANAAHDSANAAAQSALDAAASVPENLIERVTATETKNTNQDARLDAVESGVTAISTTLIGAVIPITCADGYVPNGCVPANGGEYTRAQFPNLYDTYLAGGKLLTCTYAAWATQVALTGNCGKFALDADNQKFKVPLLKDGDSITQAASAAELGKSVKAGLPNITGTSGAFIGGSTPTGAFTNLGSPGYQASTGTGLGLGNTGFNAALSSPIYGNSTTVTDEQIRLRHFVVLASAQNNASVFDWSNYMAGLAGKANTDLSNVDMTKANVVLQTKRYSTGEFAQGSTVMPYDNTIPQQTEGDQYMALTITPRKSNSLLRIDVLFVGGITAASNVTLALFKDWMPDALAAATGTIRNAGGPLILSLSHVVVSGGVSPITFTVRAGVNASTALQFNGNGGGAFLGGVANSSIAITEFAA